MPGILPPLTPREMLEVSMIASIAGVLQATGMGRARAFRAPHHSASMAALVGGGLRAKPGEVSLAHRGILFLDELPEFPRQVLDSLRQPIETGEAVVARANAHVTYPARFQLVAAMNPCRCGHAGDLARACPRVPRCVGDYQSKLSGPLLDRIDIHIEVPPGSPADLALPPKAQPKWPPVLPPPATFSRRVMHRFRHPWVPVPPSSMRKSKASCWKRSPVLTRQDSICCAMPPSGCV